jgi:hypothetical protein
MKMNERATLSYFLTVIQGAEKQLERETKVVTERGHKLVIVKRIELRRTTVRSQSLLLREVPV